jgi:hypothetical protein
MINAAVVLATVNAPHSKQLKAQDLAYYLLHPAAAEAVSGHMSSFFGEVSPDLQVEFAHQFNVTNEQLATAAKSFAAYSGATYPLAA